MTNAFSSPIGLTGRETTCTPAIAQVPSTPYGLRAIAVNDCSALSNHNEIVVFDFQRCSAMIWLLIFSQIDDVRQCARPRGSISGESANGSIGFCRINSIRVFAIAKHRIPLWLAASQNS